MNTAYADAYVNAADSQLRFSFLFPLVNVDSALSCTVTKYVAQCTYAVSRSQTDVIHNISDRLLSWDTGRLFSSFCSSRSASQLADMLKSVTPYVSGLPRGCEDFLRAVPGDFKQATSEAYYEKCVAVTLMLERPDPDDPIARYMGSESISVELGDWGTTSGHSCLLGPSYDGLVDDLVEGFPPDQKLVANYVRLSLAQR